VRTVHRITVATAPIVRGCFGIHRGSTMARIVGEAARDRIPRATSGG
jgi:hypothetical protein